jgi:beta-lactamase regulating signal transducer with metallopeptidase domain
MFPSEWLAQPICRLLTLTLFHFLWQGLAIALALVAFVELRKVRQAAARYACSLAALFAMTVAPVATLAGLVLEQQVALPPEPHFSNLSPAILSFGNIAEADWLAVAQPYCLIGWLGGVVLFGSRLLTGAIGVARLRRSCLPLPPKLTKLVEQLGRRMQMEALSLVFLSRQTAEAMAVGLVRPLVLIPAAWATEMPLDMLEAVIAHELAHLQRRDLWINLLQRIEETLFFYHPAVWWLSRRLQVERELCADELAVAATGKRLEYAKALEQIAHERQADIRPALAAFLRGETNMRLLQRVRNVLKQPTGESSRLWPVGILAFALPLALCAAAAMNAAAVADDDDDEPKRPPIKRERAEKEGGEKRAIIVFSDGDEDGDRKKRVITEEREERVIKRKPGQSDDEVIERKIITKGGKPIVEVEVGRGQPRGATGDRRLEELTVLVKRLANQVERLQDEVSELRGEKSAFKKSADDGDEPGGKRKIELKLAADKIEAAQRALEEKKKAIAEMAIKQQNRNLDEVKEHIQKEMSDKKRFIEEKAAQAAHEKAEAAREKAEAAREEVREKAQAAREKAREAIEQKIRELDDLGPEEKEALRKKLRDQQSLLRGELEKPKPKKPTIKFRDESPR